ncbi:PRKR-interacting protein 1 [Colletotrichum chlorophyti]|uniref:PRKR-interacting protein 1 n=1 Tax=Colletotrichum chlorophyti TaxID=708187 RepID=A0A1Q8S1T0_9PEZI|nr:PRKR-interacting protein 1 [Colletotrichum chlorophyti]
MSGEGPESIPTSADPRSRRPTKKRALTPSSEHAKHLEALFSKPDQEIRIPPPVGAVAKRAVAAPPEIVTNVQGSSAGAGSGEFHVYKASRRREYDRLRAMDEEVKQEKANEEFERQRAERAAKDEERTRKNREKRDKKKQRGKKGPATTGAGKDSAATATTTAAAQTSTEKDGAGDDAKGEKGGNRDADDAPSVTTGASAQPAGLVIHDDD